jgi:hypothetical protein
MVPAEAVRRVTGIAEEEVARLRALAEAVERHSCLLRDLVRAEPGGRQAPALAVPRSA